MRKNAVIVAGGSGTRMGGGIPKQFRSLCGRPVLWWSMKAFHDEDPGTRLIIVLPKDFIGLWNDFYTSLPEKEQFSHEVVAGGESRSESVTHGLALIEDKDSLVAIHDGARPLVSSEMISKGWIAAEKYGAAIPVVAVTDSLRKISEEGNEAVDRNVYKAVQTPQVFKSSLLKDAYRIAENRTFTDDASVVENAGYKVNLFEGNPDNIKITNPKDLAIAAVIMGKNA